MKKNQIVNFKITVLRKVDGTAADPCKEFHAMVPKLCWRIMALKQPLRKYYAVKEIYICAVIINF